MLQMLLHSFAQATGHALGMAAVTDVIAVPSKPWNWCWALRHGIDASAISPNHGIGVSISKQLELSISG